MGITKKIAVATLLLLVVAMTGFMMAEAARDPIVRRGTIRLAGWPGGQRPLRVVALTDLHVAGPDATTGRLARIVAQVNALKPDLVLLTGDYLSDKIVATRHWAPDDALRPLGTLHAPLGIVAVPGNHDHLDGLREIRSALTRNNVVVLQNEAVRRGPLIVMGLDDADTGHDDIERTYQSAEALGAGVRIFITHSPLSLPWVRPGTRLFVAGHTHCGQVVVPGLGPVLGRYEAPITCGFGRYRNMSVIVGAGLGTSNLPLRLGAPPDLWLITLGPPGKG